ncbi:MAG: amidohydrolase [Candidatus Koribacter versatilis]|uniref:2-amino-3-carboxymuconate-6-semialdehyde decarboxylase n=1 Tax=Candidatus Korobacter versatilis TaxID=658062 RepID=A0A932A7H4_9BACT|nr:amidohydrolase [Candidatus Koribacter versatilis]
MAQTIDIHTHWFPEAWPDFGKRFGGDDWPQIRHAGKGKAEIYLGEKPFRQIDARCWDAQARIAQMDRDGVDVQVISPTPVMFGYQRPAEQAAEAARFFNDALLEFCARGKGRFQPLCQVPLQNPKLAVRELERCMKAGHAGVEIGTHVGPKNLDDPDIVAFLAHCAQVGAAVFVHPWDMLGCDRMPNHMMPWTVGMPAETHLAIVALIKSGAFDQLPRELRVCFAHGGGSFAFLLGRLENAWKKHSGARGRSALAPQEYVKRFLVDSAVFDAKALEFLVSVMGDECVCLGSDFPYPLGEEHAGQLIRESRLPADAKAKLLGGNASRWLNLSGSHPSPPRRGSGGAPTHVTQPAHG